MDLQSFQPLNTHYTELATKVLVEEEAKEEEEELEVKERPSLIHISSKTVTRILALFLPSRTAFDNRRWQTKGRNRRGGGGAIGDL